MNTSRILIVSIILSFVTLSAFAAASVGAPSVNSVIAEIMKTQNVDTRFAIDPKLVDNALLADLGNAIIIDKYPAALINREAKVGMEGENAEGPAAIGYDYLATQWLWQRDYGTNAIAGSGWAYHDTEPAIVAGK